jgi:hypothetical protein
VLLVVSVRSGAGAGTNGGNGGCGRSKMGAGAVVALDMNALVPGGRRGPESLPSRTGGGSTSVAVEVC